MSKAYLRKGCVLSCGYVLVVISKALFGIQVVCCQILYKEAVKALFGIQVVCCQILYAEAVLLNGICLL